MKILVTGAGGQLGHDVVVVAGASGHDVHGVARSDLDVTNAAAVRDTVQSVRPDVVINAAAFTAVDACETQPELAEAVNVTAVEHLRNATMSIGAHLVHVSTDYVFDGTLDRAYREDDEPNPQSVYGRTKLAGERAAGADATVVRTSWVCGEHGNNMVKLILRLAGGDGELAFVDDQRGNPSFTADLSAALVTLAETTPGGIVHLTNAGAVSWYEFVREILEASGHDPGRVRPISTAELDPPRPAPRPANSVLANERWAALGHPPLRHHREPLRELIARLQSSV
ncbi:MAG: dTDP-4-dehydrorhamnose reductase [Actinomycetota bacterium]